MGEKGKIIVDIETCGLGGGSGIVYPKSYSMIMYKGKIISMKEYKLIIRKEKIDKLLKNGK